MILFFKINLTKIAPPNFLTYYFMKAPFLLILVSLFSFTFYSSNAQEGKLVTGKVIDEYGLPI